MLQPNVLQKSLNAKVRDQNEFQDLDFCSDQRIYELMLGESIWSVMNHTKTKDADIRLLWQSKDQQEEIQGITHSKSGSIDGAIGIFVKNIKGSTVLPIEAKSTMTNPRIKPTDSLEEQAIRRITEKYTDFSKPFQISSVLILPISPDKTLKVDLQPIANQLQSTIAKDSIGAISLLSIHENGIKLTTCVLYGKTFQLDISNIKNFMGITPYIFPGMEI